MSERSIRRANERSAARARRREALRRRRAGLATGAAIGAAALFAPGAQAATFEVTSLADGPPDACDTDCTLRDAVEEANAGSGSDRITFASGLSGTITLTAGQIEIGYGGDLEIAGPGADVITVDADGSSRIFNVSGKATTISGLHLTGGSADRGGAIIANAPLTVADAVIAGNTAVYDGGGVFAQYAALELQDATVSGNAASRGAGIASRPSTSKYSPPDRIAVSGSRITGNEASTDGGAIAAGGSLTVTGSTISGNTADRNGGGVLQRGKYAPLDVADSIVSGNEAGKSGGGVLVGTVRGPFTGTVDRSIARTAITGNKAAYGGAGLYLRSSGDGDEITVSRSTISGNASEGYGGGIKLGGDDGPFNGDLLLTNSTVSGNTAARGAGVMVGNPENGYPVGPGDKEIENSTIAANVATAGGGGIALASYGGGISYASYGGGGDESATVLLTSTVVGDNTAAGSPQDLGRDPTAEGGGFDLAFSLIEAAGNAPLFQSDGNPNIVGVDPKLGALADNGGPTPTHLPADDSPLVDKGKARARMNVDQRGEPRTVDTWMANATNGDGTDIGSVELRSVPEPAVQEQPPAPPPPSVIKTRVPPGGINVRVTPKRDRKLPFRFRTRGAIVPPGSMSADDACGSVGFVSVQVKIRGTTISTRRARVRPNCRFGSRVTFTVPRRFGRLRDAKPKRLKFTVRFTGNDRLEPATSKPRFVRVR